MNKAALLVVKQTMEEPEVHTRASDQLLSSVQFSFSVVSELFATPQTAAQQASLSITSS